MEQLQRFTDRHGNQFFLSPAALRHIRDDNHIADPTDFIAATFHDAIAIIKSRWKPTGLLYYARQASRRYKTVVVDVKDRRIKTAYISEKIKGGEIVWRAPRAMT